MATEKPLELTLVEFTNVLRGICFFDLYFSSQNVDCLLGILDIHCHECGVAALYSLNIRHSI